MKKIIFKFVVGIIFIFMMLLLFKNSFIQYTKSEFSLKGITKIIFGTNFFANEVSNNYIDVISYNCDDEYIYCNFAGSELSLPYSGICYKRDKNNLYLDTSIGKIELHNLNDTYLNIYESFLPNQKIASINGFVIIKTENDDLFKSKLIINNEKI